MQLPMARLEAIRRRHDLIAAELAAASDPRSIAALAREAAELAPVVADLERLAALDAEGAELAAMIGDPEMGPLAERELATLEERRAAIVARLRLALLPADAADRGGVILEVRAGTGGDEAALFAGDLLRMYRRYAERRGWRVEAIGTSEGTMGGVREAIVEIEGEGVFGRLRHESGVHRIQRVPATESQGRIHTSAATVAVLPLASDVTITLDERDLRIETMRAGGAGGQHVNKTDSAVRLTHLPTGLVVVSQDQRSQHQNRAKAIAVLRARLNDQAREAAANARAAERRAQVGSGDRSERIRTYNVPQGRLTDHRIGLTLYNLDRILEGDLDPVLDPLIAEHQAAQLAAEGL